MSYRYPLVRKNAMLINSPEVGLRVWKSAELRNYYSALPRNTGALSPLLGPPLLQREVLALHVAHVHLPEQIQNHGQKMSTAKRMIHKLFLARAPIVGFQGSNQGFLPLAPRCIVTAEDSLQWAMPTIPTSPSMSRLIGRRHKLYLAGATDALDSCVGHLLPLHPHPHKSAKKCES